MEEESEGTGLPPPVRPYPRQRGADVRRRPEAPASLKQAYAQAVGLLEGLNKDDPHSPVYRLDLARVYRDYALFLTRDWQGKGTGDPDQIRQAGEYLLQSVSLSKRVRDDFPDVPPYELEVAASLVQRGVYLRRANEAAAAKAAFDEALRHHGRPGQTLRRRAALPRGTRPQFARHRWAAAAGPQPTAH